MREITIRTTKDQILQFKESILWKDMRRELLMWKRQFQQEYDDVVGHAITGDGNSASILTHLGDLHGRGAAIDYVLQLPDVFIQIIEDNVAEKEKV